MSGIGIIANPHSKLNKRDPWRKQLLSYIVGSQGKVEVTQSVLHLRQVAQEFKDQSIEIVAINGGDGTISQTLTAFIDTYGETPLPHFALLRGGTMNMLASNLGIQGSPEQVLAKLVESYASKHVFKKKRLNSLRVGGQYGFLFGTGVSAAFLETFYQHKSGPIGVLWLMLRIVMSRVWGGELFRRVLKSESVRLTSKDQDWRVECHSCGILASTVRKIPMGFPMFHQAEKPQQSDMEVLCFTIPSEKIVTQLFPVVYQHCLQTLFPKWHQKRRLFSCLSKNIEIYLSKTNIYTLDGEIFKTSQKRLHVDIGPSITFLLP